MHRLFQSILSQIEKVFWLNDPVHSSSKVYKEYCEISCIVNLWKSPFEQCLKFQVYLLFKTLLQTHKNTVTITKMISIRTCFNIKLLQWNLININVQIRCTVCPVDKASLPCTYFTDTTGYLPQGDFQVTVHYSKGLLFRWLINPKMKKDGYSERSLIQNWNKVHFSKGLLVQNQIKFFIPKVR